MVNISACVQASFDVRYFNDFAVVGYAIFKDHRSADPIETGQKLHYGIEPYEPGSFYKRELPCLLGAINQLKYEFEIIYIDANVWLGNDKPGLGYHLYHSLNKKVPVIGISKSKYFGETELIRRVLRKNSNNPLYASSIGIDLDAAVLIIEQMQGEFRIPALIKLADTMSKKAISPPNNIP